MAQLTRRTRTKRQRGPKIDHTKIGKLVRLLASDKAGEVVATADALKRTLEAGGLDLHDLADIVEAGLRRPAERQQHHPTSWAPPLPSTDSWQDLAWYCHFHRDQLRGQDRERVADYLLGQAFNDTGGRCLNWHLEELRGMVASIRRKGAEVAP
jgi:hypothetical protein